MQWYLHSLRTIYNLKLGVKTGETHYFGIA